MSDLPAGTVTFFFSDIEGSTRLLETLGAAYPELLDRHRAIVRAGFSAHGGYEVSTQGDSFFAAFSSAGDAIRAAIEIQRTLSAARWPDAGPVRVRIGLHTGDGIVVADDYVGLDVHRAARVMAAAHGGQVLASATTAGLAGRAGIQGVELRDLGEHRLRDLSTPERLYQVVAPGLDDAFPSPRTLDSIPNNLPRRISRVVGREAELAKMDELVGSGARIVTLTGPGGIGKTTLALQAAPGLADRFADGVFFVDLSGVTDADGLLDAVARNLGLQPSGSGRRSEAVVAELANRSVLVILDNFEQVIAAATEVARLVAACPRLTAIVTSREPLRVRGEQTLPVAPLSLPELGATPTAADVVRSDAVALFLERAREVQPDIGLSDETAPVVAEICARLDGLPLAIELAAARLRLFSLDELHDRLRLELLRGGARDLPARQQTLRSTIGWSYDLLDADERTLFAVLSLFPTAAIEAVEAVAAQIEGLTPVDVLDRLASLVDKSLVRRIDENGRDRLTMLETIREYASERLGADATLAASARRAHAAHYAALAESRREDLLGPRRRLAVEELEADVGNLVAAWRYFVEARELSRLQGLLDPLWAIHESRGRYAAAVGLADDLLAVLDSGDAGDYPPEKAVTLRLIVARGLLAIRGYRPEVEAVYRDALALAEGISIPPKLAVVRSLASFHLARGELDKTAAIGRRLLEDGERSGDLGLQVEGHLLVGPSLAFLGDRDAGTAHLDRAIELFDPQTHGRSPLRLGPNPGVAAYSVSALFRWLFGDPDAADRFATSALQTAERLAHPYSLAYATFHVALLDLWSERFEQVADRASAVVRIADERDYPVWRAIGIVLEGVAASALGRPGEGLERVDRGIGLYEDLAAPPIFWPQVLGLRARACAATGRIDDAVAVVEEGLRIAGSHDPFDQAPMLVQLGDLETARNRPSAAREALLTAHEAAGRIGMPMIALLAATRLARAALAGSPGDVERLRTALGDVRPSAASAAMRDAEETLAAATAATIG
ncbi:MAG TPA: adenylate/guanylate cyclase domain-containing protein [Candidatus Limnocylindrales bacterium]|nr:adenylate/guanylate cyclase domain-containing protein [Candidatus Limnocylindrales bacterium]